MKAMVCTRYGPPEVLQLREVPKPLPKDDEVLIKIHATTVTAGDCEIRGFRFPLLTWIPLRLVFGIRRPRKNIFGQEVSGVIEAVGRKVTNFKAGDAVFASTEMRLGGYAEYVCLKADAAIAPKPGNLDFDKAAAVPMALEALFFLRKGKLGEGERVLINGAGGSIGTAAVQIAKYLGASVTGVDGPEKKETIRSLGAESVIDCTKEDFTQNRETYDVVFDVVNKTSFSRTIKVLKKNGRYIFATPELSLLIRGMKNSVTGGRKIITGLASYKAKDLVFIKGLVEAGKLKPVVDRIYPLEQAAEAHQYVETGQKKGDVVLRVRS